MKKLIYYIIILWGLVPELAWAKKTAQPVYVHPFDYGAGGTNLCLASHEGVLFANPSMMPFGHKFFRWVGLKNTFIFAPDSALILAAPFAGGVQSQELIEQAFETPVHIGYNGLFSFITNNVGFSTFGLIEPDIKVSRYGDLGVPEIRLRTDAYSGFILGSGFQAQKWLSFGLGLKFMSIDEADIRTDVTDANSVRRAVDFSSLKFDIDAFGVDLGTTIFLQNKFVDYRFVLKADDVGGTKRQNGELAFEPTYHVGTSVTFHTTSDMIHFEINYRDVTDVHALPMFKKIYAGAKLTVENLIGFSAGLHHGYPSAAMALDFVILNIGASYYTLEMGNYPGEDPREIISLYFNLGI